MESSGGAQAMATPAIRIDPAPLSPEPSGSPSPTKSNKPFNQPKSKASTSRRGFALKRTKSATPGGVEFSPVGTATDASSTLTEGVPVPSLKESRSLSPFAHPDAISKPIRDVSTDGAAPKPELDVWTNRKSSHYTDDDLEELLRSRSLRRVTSRIQDESKSSADVDKIPDKFLTEEASLRIWERSKATVNIIEKLQRHFMGVKEKLYRARCLGMDQGIEAVQKGDSPLLEQHMTRIQQTGQEELDKARALQEARKESLETEYSCSVRALWESMDLELARRMKLSRNRLVEEMIKNESDFMQNQLRHIFSKWKEDAGHGISSTHVVYGVVIDTSVEASLDETMSDLWKLMKASIRQKYWDKYLSSETELLLEEEEHSARQRIIRETLLQGGQGTDTSLRRKESFDSNCGKSTKKAKMDGLGSADLGMIVEEVQQTDLVQASGGVNLPLLASHADTTQNPATASLSTKSSAVV